LYSATHASTANDDPVGHQWDDISVSSEELASWLKDVPFPPVRNHIMGMLY
jgi:hypothetical protein